MGILITLMHIIGGLLTGYYAYFLRMQVEGGTVLDFGTLAGYASEYPMFLVGPMVIILTILVHRFEIMHARATIDAEKRKARILGNQLDASEQTRKDNEKVVAWVREAVDSAVVRDRKRQEAEAEAILAIGSEDNNESSK